MNGFDRSVGIALKRKYQRAVLRTAGAELLIRLKAHIADIHHIIPVLPQQILGVGDKHGGDLIPYDQGPAAAADHFRSTPDQSLVDQLEPPRKAPEGILHIGNGMGGIPAQHAMDLIQRYGSVEAIYADLDGVEAKPAVKKKLAEGEEQARMSYDLATIRCDAPIEFAPEDAKRREADGPALEITCDPDAFNDVVKALEGKGYAFASAEIEMVPQNYITLTGEGDVKNMEKLIDMLEDNDDVQNVWHNWDND